MFAAVRSSKCAVSANRSIETWFATVSSQNRAGLKAGQFKGTKRVFWRVTWQAVGTVPVKVSTPGPAFRLIKCVGLAGRCIPCHSSIVTHNALRDLLTIKVIKAAVSCELVQAKFKTIAYLSKRMIPWVALKAGRRPFFFFGVPAKKRIPLWSTVNPQREKIGKSSKLHSKKTAKL